VQRDYILIKWKTNVSCIANEERVFKQSVKGSLQNIKSNKLSHWPKGGGGRAETVRPKSVEVCLLRTSSYERCVSMLHSGHYLSNSKLKRSIILVYCKTYVNGKNNRSSVKA
jgi:hypothetical protein